ncbi:hypothetical protein [Nocardia wallacei]|uniref:hypothetical protein n=1 Tax=Nocardia wallacei TaxID=480035 RepID=UPI0024572BD0|nr:hypothetical protein [Nocardia wallacei]
MFLKIDADRMRTDAEVEAMARAPIPTPEILWRQLAALTLGHREHLADVVAGYGAAVDLEVIRAWWSLRSLRGIRWLVVRAQAR